MRSPLSLFRPKHTSIAREAEKNVHDESSAQDDASSTLRAPLSPPSLKVKRVDHYFSRWQKKWKYENTGTNIIPELRPLPESSSGGDDPWQVFCLVVIREIPREQDRDPYFKTHIKSPYLIQACKEVIKEMVGLSWTAIPLQVSI